MRRAPVGKPTEETLREMVRQIIAVTKPLEIILFGSAAREEMGPESDLDVLIVVPEGTHRRQTAQLLYQEISGIGLPFDLVVVTPGDLEKYGSRRDLIFRSALEEGRRLYAA